MKILYYDCFAGISGDMNLGAMINLGVDAEYLKSELKKLQVSGFYLDIKTDQRCGIKGTKVNVVVENDSDNMRGINEIKRIIYKSNLSEEVKKISEKIFYLIGVAESKIHQVPIEKLHFHEIGALDSIVDIIGAALCLEYLKVDKIVSSPVQVGSGLIRCQHGVMPVPAPATVEILKGVPIKTGLVNYEATTPTGAAILMATVTEFIDKIDMSICKIGYGIGERNTKIPNILRVFLSDGYELVGSEDEESYIILESNIDDMNPEHYEFILEKLLESGAQDTWLTSVIMKKSRPAIQLSVLCEKAFVDSLKEIIFLHSTTIGIREYTVRKNMLNRCMAVISTRYGDVRVKQSFYQGELLHSKPEFDDCKKLAREHNVKISDVEKDVEANLCKY